MDVIGVSAFCNTGAICVHEINDEQVLASINGESPEWCDVTEKQNDDGEWESGFTLGSFFVPFSTVERI